MSSMDLGHPGGQDLVDPSSWLQGIQETTEFINIAGFFFYFTETTAYTVPQMQGGLFLLK